MISAEKQRSTLEQDTHRFYTEGRPQLTTGREPGRDREGRKTSSRRIRGRRSTAVAKGSVQIGLRLPTTDRGLAARPQHSVEVGDSSIGRGQLLSSTIGGNPIESAMDQTSIQEREQHDAWVRPTPRGETIRRGEFEARTIRVEDSLERKICPPMAKFALRSFRRSASDR